MGKLGHAGSFRRCRWWSSAGWGGRVAASSSLCQGYKIRQRGQQGACGGRRTLTGSMPVISAGGQGHAHSDTVLWFQSKPWWGNWSSANRLSFTVMSVAFFFCSFFGVVGSPTTASTSTLTLWSNFKCAGWLSVTLFLSCQFQVLHWKCVTNVAKKKVPLEIKLWHSRHGTGCSWQMQCFSGCLQLAKTFDYFLCFWF